MDPVFVPNNKFGIHILFPGELETAAKLVNSSGGDWGYVTIPLQSDDRNLEKWQKFMDDAKQLHLIPIIRLATYPVSNYWLKPTLDDAVDFANFLNSLSWPVKNRYIILFNEPNEAKEWGYSVKPDEYAEFSNHAIDIFKTRNSEFYLLNAGLDASLPNSAQSMDEYLYMKLMNNSVPGIFGKFDGFNSHSYPNPNFSSHPFNIDRYGIHSFEKELNFIQNTFGVFGKKVFITETGWNNEVLDNDTISMYFQTAYRDVWNKEYIVAVTPFLLSAGGGPFAKFSWTSPSYEPLPVFNKIQKIAKIKGQPSLSENLNPASIKIEEQSNWSAQKTGMWNSTSRKWIKNILNFLTGQ
jgi:hypothetical protein